MCKFFMKPSDLVSHEKSLDHMPLRGTLGWCEIEEAMFWVISQMAEEHDNWLGPATLGEYSSLLVIGSEAIVKIHRGINSRS